MYGTYLPNWFWGDSRAAPQNSPYIFYRQFPIYLGGKIGTERIVLYTTPSRLKAMAQIQKYDKTSGKWVVEYQKEEEGIPNFSVLTGYWEQVKQNIVVLYSVTGSGGFLSYTVIGRSHGKIVAYGERKDIFLGSIFFEGGQLIEGYGIRYRIVLFRNRRLTVLPYKAPIIPGAFLIEFSVNPNGKVIIKKTKYSVPSGSIVQIVRTDTNGITERVLYGYTSIMKYIPHRNAFKVLDRGKIELTIIPGGYDWDKAVNVVIKVV